MKKALLAILGVGFNRAVKNIADEGIYISGGIGRNKDTGDIESHLGITTWDGRFSDTHRPPQLRQYYGDVVEGECIDTTEGD